MKKNQHHYLSVRVDDVEKLEETARVLLELQSNAAFILRSTYLTQFLREVLEGIDYLQEEDEQ